MNNNTDPAITGARASRKKRNRVPLSCTICRKRRLRCDKQKPSCSNCCLLNISHLCHYMRQTWAENEEEWLEDDEIGFLRRKSDNLSGLIETSAASNLQQWPVIINNNYIPCFSNQIEINFDTDSAAIENDKPCWENKFKYNPSNNPVTILKSDPKLSSIWNEVIRLHDKLDEELSNNLSGNHKNENLNTIANKTDQNDLVTNPHLNDRLGIRENNILHASQPTKYSINIPSSEDTQNIKRIPTEPNSNKQYYSSPIVNDDKTDDLRKCNSISNLLNDVPQVYREERVDNNPEYVNDNEHMPVEKDLNVLHEYVTNNPKKDIIDSLVHFLPSRLETELLIQTFFKYLYPSMPFLDSKNLNIQFHKIFSYDNNVVEESPPPDGKLLTIKLSNYNDYCNLGIIIIIIKLTEISYSSKNNSDSRFGDGNADNIDLNDNLRSDSQVFKHELPTKLIVLIEKEFIKINENLSDVYVPLPLIHFTLLCNIYCKSSDEVDNSFRSNCSIENIVHLALTFGLNVDPDSYSLLGEHKISNDNSSIPPNIERYKHTWRKTWYFVVSLDVTQALDFGKTRLLKNLREISNTKLPIFSNVDYVKNIQELIVVKNFTLFFEIDLIVISILNLFSETRYHNKTKLKLDVIINSLVDLIYGRKSTKETLLILDNLNILPEQEVWLRVHFCSDLNESYNLPDIQTLLHSQSNVLNFTELERKLEIPKTSIVTSVFFVKHIILRHLIFEFNWKSFTYFASTHCSDVLSNFYCREGFFWTKSILEDILHFYNDVLKEIGIGERIVIPPLLQILFASVQFLTSLRSRNDNMIDNNVLHLMNAITRLLKKTSKFNKRAGVIFDFIDNFNKIYLQEENQISTDSNLEPYQRLGVQSFKNQVYIPIGVNVPQHQYIVPDHKFTVTNINTIESENLVPNGVKPNTAISSGNFFGSQFPVTTFQPNQYISNEQALYSNPSPHWPHNVFDYNQNINPVPVSWTALQHVSQPYVMQGTREQTTQIYVQNPQIVVRNDPPPYIYPQVNSNITSVSSNQRPPPTTNNTNSSTAAQFYLQSQTNFPGENNIQ